MIIFFFCNDGFQIEGDQLLQCLESGMWNNDTPTCVEIDSKSEYLIMYANTVIYLAFSVLDFTYLLPEPM